MKNKWNILPVFMVGVLLASCEKTIELDTKQTQPKLVIEGQVTDLAGYQYIKVSRTVGFYSKGTTPKVSTATVSVQDSEGGQFDFVHNPNNHPDSAGYYLPATGFVGKVGNTYTLKVQVDGQTFEAQDKLLPVTRIDSLSYGIDQEVYDERKDTPIEDFDDPKDKERYYEVYMSAKEPKETKDFYLFRYYRNGEILRDDNETDVYVADDTNVGEAIDNIPIASYFALGERVRVEIISLSREGYLYYSDLANLLNSDGGMFSPPPANPRSNISNGALGFFQVSAVNSASLVIR